MSQARDIDQTTYDEHLASMIRGISPQANIKRKLLNLLWRFCNSNAGTLKANPLFFKKFTAIDITYLREEYGPTYRVLKQSEAFKRFSWSKLSTYPLKDEIKESEYWIALVKPFLRIEQTTDKAEQNQLILEAIDIITQYVDIPDSFWSSYENWSMSMHLGSRTLGAWCQIVATSTVTAAATYCRYTNEEWQHHAPVDVMDVAGDALPIIIYLERTLRSRNRDSVFPIEKCLLFSSLWMAMRSKFLLYAITRPFASSQLLLGETLQRPGWEQQVLWSFIPESNRDFLDLGSVVGVVDIIISSMMFWGFCTQYVYSLGIPMVSWAMHTCYRDVNRKFCDPQFFTEDLVASYHDQIQDLIDGSSMCRKNGFLEMVRPIFILPYDCSFVPHRPSMTTAENVLFNITMCHSDSIMAVGSNVLGSMIKLISNTLSTDLVHGTPFEEYFDWSSSTTRLYMANNTAHQSARVYENIVQDMKLLNKTYGSIMQNWSFMDKMMRSIRPSIELVAKYSMSQPGSIELPDIYGVTTKEDRNYGSIQSRNRLDERLSKIFYAKKGIHPPSSRPTLVYYIPSSPWPSSSCVDTSKCWENVNYLVHLLIEKPAIVAMLARNVLELIRLTPSTFPPTFTQDTKVAERILLALYAGLNPLLWNDAVVPYMNNVLLRQYKEFILASVPGRMYDVYPANIFWHRPQNSRPALELIFDFLPSVHVMAPSVASTCMREWLQIGIENTIVLALIESACEHIRSTPELPGSTYQSYLNNVVWLETRMIEYILEKQIHQRLEKIEFMSVNYSYNDEPWISTYEVLIENALTPILFMLRLMPDFFSRPNLYWKRFFINAKFSSAFSDVSWWRAGLRALLRDRWDVDKVGSTYLTLLTKQSVLDAYEEHANEENVTSFWSNITNVVEMIVGDRDIQTLLPWYGHENIIQRILEMRWLKGAEHIAVRIYEANKSCFLSSLIHIFLQSDDLFERLEKWLGLAYKLIQHATPTMGNLVHDMEDAIDFILLFIKSKLMKSHDNLSQEQEWMRNVFAKNLNYIQNFKAPNGDKPFQNLTPFFW